jgi:hypothetical protein
MTLGAQVHYAEYDAAGMIGWSYSEAGQLASASLAYLGPASMDPSKAPAPEHASAPASVLTERTNHAGSGDGAAAAAGEQDQEDGEDGGDWEQNVCRTTKIRRMRRIARKQQQEEAGTDG